MSAANAWEAVRGVYTGATYQLVLAEANSGEALDGPSLSPRLVWVVMGSHVAVQSLVVSRLRISAASCVYESAMWPIDAQTGVALGELTFPPPG